MTTPTATAAPSWAFLTASQLPSSIMNQSAAAVPIRPPTAAAVDEDSASSSDDDDDDDEAEPTVFKRTPTVPIHAPSGCIENHLSCETDPFLQRYAARPPSTAVDLAPVKSWKDQYDTGRAFTIQPPVGHVDYTTRIRSRHLIFSVGSAYASADLGLSATSFSCVNTGALIECAGAVCGHTIVPLRLSVAGCSSVNAPPQDVAFQLTTPEVQLLGDDGKTVIREWFPPNRVHHASASLKSASASAASKQTSMGYCIPWLNGSTAAAAAVAATKPKRLYVADFNRIHPLFLDLVTQVCQPGELLRPVIRNADRAWWLEQPSPKTNVAPSWLSFIVTGHVADQPKGTTQFKRDAFTITAKKRDFFTFRPEYYLEREQKIHQSFRSKAFPTAFPVMRLDKGVTGVFTPTDKTAWNAHVQRMKEKNGGEEFMRLSVDVVIDYLVLGGVRSTSRKSQLSSSSDATPRDVNGTSQ